MLPYVRRTLTIAEIDDLSTADSSNTDRWPENMAPSAVNNAGRADEGIIARWVQHWSGENFTAVTETGVNSLSVSIARASFSNTATASKYIDGLSLLVTIPSTITGPALLSVNGHTKKSIIGPDLTSISSSFIVAGQKVMLSFDADALSGEGAWQMISSPAKTDVYALVDETSPQLGGNLDVNSNGITWPSTITQTDLLDEDDMSSDSATAGITQQSAKAYVDNNAGYQFVSTAALTTATTVEVNNFAAGYDYLIRLEAFSPTTDNESLYLRFSDDAGSTFESGASDYTYSGAWTGSTGVNATAAQIDLDLGNTCGNDAGNHCVMTIEIINPNASSEKTAGVWHGAIWNTSPTFVEVHGAFAFNQGNDAIEDIQFLWSGGSTFKAEGDISVWRRKRS